MSEKKDKQIVGNAGMYYACYQLSLLGWNVMPTSRNAKGIDIIAYSPDGKKFTGIQVKTLSSPANVPVGKEDITIMGDFWIIVILPPENSNKNQNDNSQMSDPMAYILKKKEIERLQDHYGNSLWLRRNKYEKKEFENKWNRIKY